MESHFPIPTDHQSHLARERVMDDLHALVIDAELLLKATAGDLSKKVTDARARVAANLERARATITLLKQQGIESARVAWEKADSTVRQNPYQAVAIAAGVGACVGYLLGRRLGSLGDGVIDV